MTTCIGCQSLTKKLRILQNDYKFQIKKLQQDKSSEKVLLQISFNKQIRKVQQKFQKEKEQRQKDNENWLKKVDSLEKQFQSKIAQFKTSKQIQMNNFMTKKTLEFQNFTMNTVNKYESQIKFLKQNSQILERNLKDSHISQMKQLKQHNQKSIEKLKKMKVEQIKSISAKYQETILGLQSQKKTEKNIHHKAKQELKNTQSRLHQDICCLKKTIIQYEGKVETLNQNIKLKASQIQQLKQQIKRIEQNNSQNITLLKNLNEQKHEKYRKAIEQQLQTIFKKELQNCNKYEKALQKMQEHRETQNQMYKANLRDVKTCVEGRPSRLQDVQEIVRLKQKLIKKQKQCQTLYEEMKWYKLELQNKQETYNKIFGPDSKNTENIYIRRKDIKLKRAGKSLTGVRQILGNLNTSNTNNSGNLCPLVSAAQKKIPKLNRLL